MTKVIDIAMILLSEANSFNLKLKKLLLFDSYLQQNWQRELIVIFDHFDKDSYYSCAFVRSPIQLYNFEKCMHDYWILKHYVLVNIYIKLLCKTFRYASKKLLKNDKWTIVFDILLNSL